MWPLSIRPRYPSSVRYVSKWLAAVKGGATNASKSMAPKKKGE
jgi:hypothetical protein